MFEFSSDQMYPYNLPRPMPMPVPAAGIDRRWKPNVEIAPNCPRCDSSNTKFCYYNNYSLTQPRYFCKGCRRYWTKGGSLRNIPVGGGCRKNRRAKSVRSSSASGRTSASGDHSLRPDLALDDMVGSSNRSINRSLSSATDRPSIDLAILYSKFLNHEPQQQPAAARSNDDQDLAAVPAEHQSFHDHLVGSSSGSDQAAGLIGDQFSYGFDPSGTSYESLALDLTAAVDQASDVFSTNSHQLFQNFPWQAPEQLQQTAGFCPVSDIDISSHHHHQGLIINDWCTSIDQSSFGAF